uniref:Uncharacterized protein n=1 Tax=Cacopsylla melanoneura TaxID=428564 RepID=A0A8D9AH30_9HEMI
MATVSSSTEGLVVSGDGLASVGGAGDRLKGGGLVRDVTEGLGGGCLTGESNSLSCDPTPTTLVSMVNSSMSSSSSSSSSSEDCVPPMSMSTAACIDSSRSRALIFCSAGLRFD